MLPAPTRPRRWREAGTWARPKTRESEMFDTLNARSGMQNVSDYPVPMLRKRGGTRSELLKLRSTRDR